MRGEPNERENMTEGVRKHAAANWTIITNDARESLRVTAFYSGDTVSRNLKIMIEKQ